MNIFRRCFERLVAKTVRCTGYAWGDGGCGAKLLVDEASVQSELNRSYGEYDGRTFFVVCPHCKKRTRIERSES